MAVTLVATVGASTSNSYVTEAEANAYFDNHPDESTWDGLADSDTREKLLILATRHIDMLNIDGVKNDTSTTSGAPDQALKFPRSEDTDDGSEFIPIEVKRATYEEALHLAISGTSTTRSELQEQGVSEIQLPDGLREVYGNRAAGSARPVGSKAYAILRNAGFLKVSSGVCF